MIAQEALAQGMLSCYENIDSRIKDMTKVEMGVFIQSYVNLVAKSQGESTRKIPGVLENSHPASIILSALSDYKRASYLLEIREEFVRHSVHRTGLGQVYVIEFDDGCIKIGHSSSAAARVKGISGGNQAYTLRSWFSTEIEDSQRLEKAAHREFAKFRKGGEFFTTSFSDAVTFIEGNYSHNVCN